jgi:hypothetical protein
MADARRSVHGDRVRPATARTPLVARDLRGVHERRGLLYASSMHANRPALALYERAQTALPAAPVFHRALSDPALVPRLNAAATALGYRLV